MKPADQAIVAQSLKQTLTDVAAMRRQLDSAQRVLDARVQALRDSLPPQPEDKNNKIIAPANPAPARPPAPGDVDYAAQITDMLDALGDCDCENLRNSKLL